MKRQVSPQFRRALESEVRRLMEADVFIDPKISLKKDMRADRANAYIVTLIDSLTGKRGEKSVSTDDNGKGLWVDGKQVLGTGQFRFRGPDSYRRYFQQQYS